MPATDIDRLLAARAGAVDAQVRAGWQRCIPRRRAAGAVRGRRLRPRRTVPAIRHRPAGAGRAGGAEPTHADALARFFALLWDAGLPVGHAVRSVAQCTEAAADITVLTAMMEARPLVADAAAAATRWQAAIAPSLVWPPQAFFEAKREELRARHARFGDTADNLEPNLKEGPGGLRDVQTLRWMALRIIGTGDLESLVALGQLGADEHATLERERRALSRLRFGLHLVAGKREERLRFDYQKLLAARLGHVDDADNLAVEQMMQGFYRSAALVLRIGDRLLQRFEEQLEGEAVPQPLDDAVRVAPRLPGRARPRRGRARPTTLFALFAVWASRADIRGLHSQTARALAEALPTVPAYAQAAPALRAALPATAARPATRWPR